jgi:hypothetical protein
MARVMEFQYQQGLATDGAVGLDTLRALQGTPTSCINAAVPQGRCILVDLIDHRLFAFLNGTAQLKISPIRGGRVGHPSHRGVFQMSSRRLRHHTSTEYPFPPGNMDFALFYNGSEAIHQGPPTVPSHGCIHVGPPSAENLFNWAGQYDIIVIVVKLTP